MILDTHIALQSYKMVCFYVFSFAYHTKTSYKHFNEIIVVT